MPGTDLWPGAEVRWVGPDLRRGRRFLRTGDRGVVVDGGRSYTTWSVAAMVRRPRLTKASVLVAFDDGAAIAVPRGHLEAVPAEHPLSPQPDSGVASWFLRELAPWLDQPAVTAASLVPPFPAVARILHPWWQRGSDGERPVPWSVVARAEGIAGPVELDARRDDAGVPQARSFLPPWPGRLDQATAHALVQALAAATTTPREVHVGVWTGWGDVPTARFPGAAVAPTEGRGHFLLRGPLEGVLTPVSVIDEHAPVSGLWWPDDRAWFVATGIDLEWTFVAGEPGLIERLLAHEALEALPAARESPAARLG